MSIIKKVDVFADNGKQARTTSKSRVVQQENHSELVDDFINLMDTWHGTPEVWDDQLDAAIHKMEYEVRTTHRPKLAWGPKGTKYFSPSSANSDARELYLKLAKAPRDRVDEPPFRGRWKRLGTLFGDMIQVDLLYIMKHFEKTHGRKPEFTVETVEIKGKKFPAWEKFAQKIKWVEHRGHKIPILGQPDGILKHTESGRLVGLEIKSKQTTNAQTSKYSMRNAQEDHIKQVINYSILYGVDDHIIFYGNLSKKGWFQTPEDYEKTPDIRAFHYHVTEEDRQELLDYYADILDAIEIGVPPKMDLEKWTFNNYKTATATSLSEAELEELREYAERVKRSSLPKWKIANFTRAISEIEEVRENAKK
jgi:hypothetical protein